MALIHSSQDAADETTAPSDAPPRRAKCEEFLPPWSVPLSAGDGLLQVQPHGKYSHVTRAAAMAPMRWFISPRKRVTPLVYMSSYGGGLLAGDEVRMAVHLEAGSRCVVSSQASTKIYRNPERRPCGQFLRAQIDPEAMLVFAPEAIAPFAESRYEQQQVFNIAAGGNLVLVDWLSSGRYEVGERFAFDLFESRQSIYYDGRHIFEDAVRLQPSRCELTSPYRMGAYNCIGLFVLVGEQLADLSARILEAEKEQPLESAPPLFYVAQPLPQGCFVRVLCTETQPVRYLFSSWLEELTTMLRVQVWAGKH